MTKNDIFKEQKDFFSVTSGEDVAEKLGFSRNTARTWRQNGELSENALKRFEKIKNDMQNDIKNDVYRLKKVTAYKASAGAGNDIDSIEVYETGATMQLDKSFFKTPPSKTLRVIQVDGYSMIPMLLPDSWVVFDETSRFKADGLYVINYSGQLMVKLLQLNPSGILDVISKNPDYKSYQIDLSQNNEYFKIIGKVVKAII